MRTRTPAILEIVALNSSRKLLGLHGESFLRFSHINFVSTLRSSLAHQRRLGGKVVRADEHSVPYAGLYIVPAGHCTLEQAQTILERADFLDYVRQHGVPTTGNSYRISSKLVENYRFDF